MNDPPPEFRMVEQLDRVNSSPLGRCVIERTPSFITAPCVRHIAEAVDPPAGFDLVEVVGGEERRRVRLILLERHAELLRPALLVDPSPDLKRLRKETLLLA